MCARRRCGCGGACGWSAPGEGNGAALSVRGVSKSFSMGKKGCFSMKPQQQLKAVQVRRAGEGSFLARGGKLPRVGGPISFLRSEYMV